MKRHSYKPLLEQLEERNTPSTAHLTFGYSLDCADDLQREFALNMSGEFDEGAMNTALTGVQAVMEDSCESSEPPAPPPSENAAPVIDPIDDLTAAVGDQIDLTATATDPDGDPVTFSLTDGPDGMTVDGVTGNILWDTTGEVAGDYPVTISASDGTSAGDTEDFTITLTEAPAGNLPPVLDPLADQAVDLGAAVTADANATDPEGDPIIYALTSSPTGATIDAATGEIAWTADAEGDHSFDVTASDDQGNSASDSFTVTVGTSTTNTAPMLDPLPDLPGIVGTPVSFDANATDAEGDTLTYSLTSSPDGATIDPATGAGSWTPTAVGDESFDVSVTDGSLTATDSFTVSVTEATANLPPVFVPIDDQAVPLGSSLAVDANAVDPEGGPLTYSLQAAPAGATIDTTTGEIAWTPDAIGDSSFVVQAMDDGGAPATENFTVVVFQPSSQDPPTGTDEVHQAILDQLASIEGKIDQILAGGSIVFN